MTNEAGEPLETEDGEPIEVEVMQGDTLYFNAFTEDLFPWDNDLDDDSERKLKINSDPASSPGWKSWKWIPASAAS